MARKIPLLDLHREMGATVGEFAGFETPILYDSILKEHLAVRNDVGIFDISHMAIYHLKGEGSIDLLEKLVARKISDTPPLNMRGPALMLNEKGGIKDDVMLYRISRNEWILVGNAVNTEKDYKWIKTIAEKQEYIGEIKYLNDKYALLALQGSRAPQILSKINRKATELRWMEFILNVSLGNSKAWILSRSGWTGEDGFEIIASHEDAERIFRDLVSLGAKPCGLGARDSLRLEMGYLLYGMDMDEDTNPVEARYWMGFDEGKEDCIGCSSLRDHLKRGASKVRVALRLSKKDRAIPRHGMSVEIYGEKIGIVTSGGYSPVLSRPIAMAYVSSSHGLMGLSVQVNIRGKKHKAKITDFPLLKRR